MKEAQKLFLNKLFDNGLRWGNKITAEKAAQKICSWKLSSCNNNKVVFFKTSCKEKKKREIYEKDENSNENEGSDSDAESKDETPDTTEEEKLEEEKKMLNQKID